MPVTAEGTCATERRPSSAAPKIGPTSIKVASSSPRIEGPAIAAASPAYVKGPAGVATAVGTEEPGAAFEPRAMMLLRRTRRAIAAARLSHRWPVSAAAVVAAAAVRGRPCAGVTPVLAATAERRVAPAPVGPAAAVVVAVVPPCVSRRQPVRRRAVPAVAVGRSRMVDATALASRRRPLRPVSPF